jgi:tetratricopeptide (TPR) repeat protein
MAQGMDLHDGGKLDEAVEVYRRAVDADPTFVIAHNNLGMVYIDKEEFPHAIAALKRAVKADASYAEAYNNLGYVHRKMKEDALAAAYYEKFLALDPEVDDGPKIGQWVEKVKAQVGALPSIEADAAPQAESGAPEVGSEDMTLIMNNPPPGLTGPPEASPVAPPAGVPDAPPPATAPPAAAPPGPVAAAPAAPAGPPMSAPPIVTPVGAPAQEAPEAVCEKGIAAFEAGDLEQAETLLRQAVNMNAALGVARSALGRVLAKAGRYEEAAEELREAVTLDPTDAAAFYVLGFTLKTLGMVHEAAEAYERFLDLTPDAPEGPKIRSWVESVRASPEFTPAEVLARASADLQAGRLDEAAAACEQVLAADGANAVANALMGRILFQKGDYIRATTVLKRAEPASPDDPEIPFYLGQAYSQRGQADEAAQAFERCLQLAPDGPNAATAREWLESMRVPRAAPAGGQCGYCFRSFPEDQLASHEGKMACRDCLAILGVGPGQQTTARVVRPTGMERVAAIEAARVKRKRSGAKIVRILLAGFLALFLLFAVLLLVMKNGWMRGPLDTIGVYGALRAIGLEGALTSLGIEFPSKTTGPIDDVDPGDPGDNGHGSNLPPIARPLVILGPVAPVKALPFKLLNVELKTQGGTGRSTFRLLSGPPGMEVDSDKGAVRWRPLVGGERFRLPARHKVEVEAATSGGEKATFAFEIVTNLTFKEEGVPIDAGVPAGESLCLAVGKLNVTRDRAPDTIAVAWGRYREGSVRLLYQSAPGRFTRGEPVPLAGQPSSVVVADVTGDGRADAVVANWYRSRIHVLRQDEAGNMAQEEPLRTARGVSDLAAGDVDGDGRTDVVAAHWAAAEVHVFMQRADGDAPGRLVGPATRTTTRVSGWNRIFVGPLRGGAKGGAVYLLCGSVGEPFFKVFPVKAGVLAPYEPSRNVRLLPERPVEARLLRARGQLPCIAALVGGETPALHLLGAKGHDLAEVARADIELAPFPVAMEVADLNSDGADDVAVLYPEELRVYLNAGGPGGPFHEVGVVDIPGGTGPLATGEFTGDGVPDLLVAREDGKLQVVKAIVEVLP